MHRLFSALSLTLLLTTGCDTDKPQPGDEPKCRQPEGVPQLGAPVVLSSALPRVMGSHLVPRGCGASTQGLADTLPDGTINGNALRGRVEDLYIPVSPVLRMMDNTLESPARIIRVDAEGRATDFHVFADASSNYETGFYSVTKLKGQEVLTPRGLVLSVSRGPGGALYASNNITGTLLRFDANGTPGTFATGVDGVMTLHHDTKADVLLAVTSAFEREDRTVQRPRILRFTADGQSTELATFPEGYNYLTGFSRMLPDGRAMPLGYMIDLTQDAQGQLFAVLNLGSAVLRLRPDGTWEEYARGLVGGSGITVAADGHIFVASAPRFDTNDQLIEGLRIRAISPDKEVKTVYESREAEPYKTRFYSGAGGGEGYYPLDAIFNLHLDATGNLYLEDNLANTLTLLPRQ